MNAAGLSGVLTTIGIVVLAGVFAWRGDSPHAMVCIVALLPAANHSVASVVGSAVAKLPVTP